MSADPLPPIELPPRARLLAAADALFYGTGIRATGVDAVLEHAQVARNTLYHQFGGKDGLVAAYLRAREDRWREVWTAAIDATDDPLGRVLAIFDALEDWAGGGAARRGCAFLDAEVELGDPGHPATEVIADHHRHLADRLATLAEAADLRPGTDVAEDVLLVYRGALVGLLHEPPGTVLPRARRLAATSLARHAQPR